MTAQGRFIAPIRRPGELGVHSVDEFVFTVPDLAVASEFHKAFGLDVREEGQGIGLYTRGHPHRWATVREGSGRTKKLHHLSFGLYEEDMAAFAAKLQGLGVKRIDPPPGCETNGIWFRDGDGTSVEVHVAEKSSPADKTRAEVSARPDRIGVGAAPKRSQAGTTSPNRLAHLLLFTPDVDAAVNFYGRVLGLRLSDRSGNNIAFMHGIHGSDHHMVAFVKSDAPGLHHTSWDVGTIHEVGLGAAQMADKGFSKGWGLGRHVLGSNFFHYVRDPWGSYAEYSCDIDFIPADVDWQSGDHDGEDAFYVWGPMPPDDFAVNYEKD